MRTEIRWKAIQRITQGRLIHTMATCPLCSENRRSKTLRRPHKQDRAEDRVFAIELGRGRNRIIESDDQIDPRLVPPGPVIKPIPLTPEVLSWVRSRDIAYAKARGKVR